MQSYQPESLSEFQILQRSGKPISHLEDIRAKVIPVWTAAECIRATGIEMDGVYTYVCTVCFGVEQQACEQLPQHLLY